MDPRCLAHEGLPLLDLAATASCGTSLGQLCALEAKKLEAIARKEAIRVGSAAAAKAKGGTKGQYEGKTVERSEVPRRRRAAKSAGPVLPEAGKDNVLITSALPYVNNVPHLGNIIGCVLSADVYARWCRLRPDKNVVYICGTDEYGTATEMKALQEGLTPRQICDKYHAIHRGVYEWFDIGFDFFGRTSHPDPKHSAGWPQTEIAQEIFKGLSARGLVKEQSVEQVFCTGCTRFLADRFVEGVCPHCEYDDARGDQCDSCGKLLNATELKSPRCSVDKSHSVEVRDSSHVFLDLPSLGGELTSLVEERAASKAWSSNCVATTRAWLANGLQPRCISRDLTWGTPVPHPGFESKVFYVWYDAPIGYMSMTANYTGGYESEGWRKWWQPDGSAGKVRLAQFMGKDNIPFHSVIFPACLKGSKPASASAAASSAKDRPWTVVEEMSTTEYLQYEGGRFSKSRGVGVFGDNAKDTGLSADVWRFYLLSVRPETSDTAFSWDDLAARNNSLLLAIVGNFVNRTLSLAVKAGGTVPALRPEAFGPAEAALFESADAALAEYNEALAGRSLRSGLNAALRVAGAGNSFIQATEPWTLKKEGKDAEYHNAIALALHMVHLVAVVFEPYMPSFADRVCHLLDADHLPFVPDTFNRAGTLPVGHAVLPAVPLFRPITDDDVASWRARFGGSDGSAAGAAAAASAGAAADKKGKGKGGAKGGAAKGKGKGGAKGGAAKAKAAHADTSLPPFARVDLRVGRIVRAWDHPDADKLFCEEIDCGDADGPRQIASGLRAHYTAEQLKDRLVVVVANLKPVKMRGFTSNGMVLCANSADRSKVEFVDVPAGAKVGDRVHCGDVIPAGSAPDSEINLKGKGTNPWGEIFPGLRTDSGCVACFDGTPMTVGGAQLTAPSLADAQLS
ncbi:hypothetical protein FNF28_06758 [Cafeteria roenbergensis]|uniref:methionine--tRNA ligase n=1 Tax=Cafeteria roenbergensis TaxID=33653 RepID=A0A5A8CR74_CAFRO|nr:hypothetical protein FNF28_06758 [Cafeteria roenbergensis]